MARLSSSKKGQGIILAWRTSSPKHASLSFTRKLETNKALGSNFTKSKDQGISIPEIAGKAIIEGDKTP